MLRFPSHLCYISVCDSQRQFTCFGCKHPHACLEAADRPRNLCRYVAWVTAAFGPFWGFQEGWWSWLSGVTDNSVYPVLFLTYLDAVVPGMQLWCFCACLISHASPRWTPGKHSAVSAVRGSPASRLLPLLAAGDALPWVPSGMVPSGEAMQAQSLSLCMHAGLLTGWARSLSLFVVSIILAYLNYRGLTIVGRVAIGMTLFIVLTFVVLVGASIPHLQPANWLVVDLPSVDWRGFINVMFW